MHSGEILFERALKRALEVHWGQKTADGGPYIMHPLHVAMQFLGDEEMMAAAVLHDVCEDGGPSPAGLRAEFNKAVGDIVEALTRREGEKYRDYIERLGHDEAARAIKIEDLKHNMDLERVPVIDDDWILARTRRYHRALRRLEELDGLQD